VHFVGDAYRLDALAEEELARRQGG
jgi:hypothetical protein